MSNSSNTSNNSSIPSKADATSRHSMTANSSERSVQQSTGQASGAGRQQMKIEASSNERQLPPAGSTADNRPGFASAATLVTRLVEITDEELLEYALEFERKHDL